MQQFTRIMPVIYCVHYYCGRPDVIRGLFQKFPASYIKKHNAATLTSLFFHIISAHFNALVPSFLQLLYTSLVEEFILPPKKDLH